VHLDPHVLKLASVFAILTRLAKPEREGLDLSKKLRMYAGETVEGFPESEAARLRADTPDEGLGGVSPRFVINAISNAITHNDTRSLTSMELLLALKDSIDSDARMDSKQKKLWIVTCGRAGTKPLGPGDAPASFLKPSAAAAGEVLDEAGRPPARGGRPHHRRGGP
jgi:hypothetical protein